MSAEVLSRLYNLLAALAVWCVLLPLHFLLVLSGRMSRHELDMRMGRTRPLGNRRRVLIHAVSVGEVHAAEPLIDCLNRAAGDIGIVLSTGNRHGLRAARLMQDRRAEIEECVYAPWDSRAAVTQWLKALRPSVVAVVETELWPNLFAVCKELRIPLVLVNGRIYERDVRRYILARPLFSRVLAGVDWIGVQNETERERFIAIGAPPRLVEVAGNLKHTVPHSVTRSEELPWNHLPPGTKIVIGGSTHHPEEQWLIEVFEELKRQIPQLRLILAPRHVQRADAVVRQAERRGLRSMTLSGSRNGHPQWDLLVIDEVGQLAPAYAAGTIAVIGGSFVEKGGHNLFEAVLRDCPVIVGPFTNHVQDMVEPLRNGGGLIQLQSHRQLTETLRALLESPGRLAEIRTKGRSIAESLVGAEGRYGSVILKVLEQQDRAHG